MANFTANCYLAVADDTFEEQKVIDSIQRLSRSICHEVSNDLISESAVERITKADTDAEALGLMKEALKNSLMPGKMYLFIAKLKEFKDSNAHAEKIEEVHNRKLDSHTCDRCKGGVDRQSMDHSQDRSAASQDAIAEGYICRPAPPNMASFTSECYIAVADEALEDQKVINNIMKINRDICHKVSNDLISKGDTQRITKAVTTSEALYLLRKALKNCVMPGKMFIFLAKLKGENRPQANNIEEVHYRYLGSHVCHRCQGGTGPSSMDHTNDTTTTSQTTVEGQDDSDNTSDGVEDWRNMYG